MVVKKMTAIKTRLLYSSVGLCRIASHYLRCSRSITCDVPLVHIHNETTQSRISPGARKIEIIIDALGSLTPHQVTTHDQGSVESDAVEFDQDSCGTIDNSPTKSYSSFTHLKSLIEQTLIKQPKLIESDLKTTNTVNIIKLLHGNLGLGLRAIVRLITRHPEVFQLTETTLKQRIENFRSLNLREGILQRAISRTPKLLSMPEIEVKSTVSYLTGDLDFTVKELPELFLYSPQLFFDPLEVTDRKFQYIFFTMGYKQHNLLARHGVMQYNLRHIRTRHLFLERRGQYQLADKKGSLTISNPKIRLIICSTDAYFCGEVAFTKPEEYKFFKRVLQAEDLLRDSDSKPDRRQRQEFADKILKEMS